MVQANATEELQNNGNRKMGADAVSKSHARRQRDYGERHLKDEDGKGK
jgi:hypothetical protein